MKNILQIQFSTKSAGSSAWRLHNALKEIPGYSSEVISLVRDEEKRMGCIICRGMLNFLQKSIIS